MPEYDAFGRRTDEDPLASFGGTTEPAPRPSPPPVTEAPVVASSPPSAAPPPPPVAPPAPSASWPPRPGARRRRRGPRLARLAVLTLVAGLIAAGGVAELVDTAGETFTRELAPAPALPVPQEADRKQADRKAPRAVRSMLERGALAAGLRRVEAEAPGRLRTVRVEAARVDVHVQRPGKLRLVQLRAGAEAPTTVDAPASGLPDDGLFSYDDVRPGAVERLLKASNRRLERRTAQVGYLVLNDFGGQLLWGVYYRDGAIAQGDARGRFLRRIS